MGGRGSSATRNTSGIPNKMPELEEVLTQARSLKGKALDKAITELEWDGTWYREDKRQKKGFIEGVIRNNYNRDPVEGSLGIQDSIEVNRVILSAVYGISGPREYAERFGSYDVDKLYLRRKR